MNELEEFVKEIAKALNVKYIGREEFKNVKNVVMVDVGYERLKDVIEHIVERERNSILFLSVVGEYIRKDEGLPPAYRDPCAEWIFVPIGVRIAIKGVIPYSYVVKV